MATKCIYKKGRGKDPGFGDVEDIRIGDGVSYNRGDGYRSARIDKLSIPARRLRTEAFVVGKTVLRPSVTLTFDEILEIHRKVELLDPPAPSGSSEPTPES